MTIKSGYKTISKSYDEDEDGFNGALEAYIVNTTANNLKNYLTTECHDFDEKMFEFFSSMKDKEILVLRNIYVDEEFRGNGCGKYIMDEVFNHSFDMLILVADLQEEQKQGFSLTKFYEGYDLTLVKDNNGLPVMVYPENVANRLKNKLENNPTKKLKM